VINLACATNRCDSAVVTSWLMSTNRASGQTASTAAFIAATIARFGAEAFSVIASARSQYPRASTYEPWASSDTIRVPGGRRDDLRKYLGDRGIGTQIHYPVPIHLQQSAEFLGYRKGDMPVTERVASEVLSLPMFAELTDEQLERVADSVRSFMKGN